MWFEKEREKIIFLVGQHCEKPKPWTFKGIFKTSVTVFHDLNLLAKFPSQPSTGLIMQPAFIQHPKKKHGVRWDKTMAIKEMTQWYIYYKIWKKKKSKTFLMTERDRNLSPQISDSLLLFIFNSMLFLKLNLKIYHIIWWRERS